MNLQAGIHVRAAKVILYTSDGNTIIYKLGDPEGNKDLLVTIEKETDYDEAFYASTPMQLVTGSRVKLSIEA